ncbi:BAG family molecular chaperone regulator 5, mitochondrial-like [Aristolochia californica]|uniref:BAG family molecular chaperone regulator 5, mitochondrial-like n=1 Tax=Aristolochia californica TaxID=171875 RepID=UPI0035E2362E
METPFFEFPAFRNPYYDAPRPRYNRSPAPHSGGLFSPNTQPKVVSIPVRFVGTDKSRSLAAVKIQKVFRGFLVRRAVKKVLKIAAEVAEVERRVAEKETAEMVRREEKERLRLNEMLMGLLFRLDSIRGFDSGVRDCRKRVIRRVIALQERVDAIAAGDMVEDGERTDCEKCSGRREEDTDSMIDQAAIDENQGAMVEGDAVYQSQIF